MFIHPALQRNLSLKHSGQPAENRFVVPFFQGTSKEPASKPRLTWLQRLKGDLQQFYQQLSFGMYRLFCKLFSTCIPMQPAFGSQLMLYQYKKAPIQNFYGVDTHFYRGAQPGITEDDRLNGDQLKAGLLFLRDQYGVRTILNLRNETDLREEHSKHPTDHIEVERKMIESLNKSANPEQQLQYISVPVESGLGVTSDQLPIILNVLKGAPQSPVFVHCKAGIDRTGIVSALYRVLTYPKEPLSAIYEEMKACGHNPNGLWKGYIKNIQWHLKSDPAFAAYQHGQTVQLFA